MAFFPSKPAPRPIRASGVARTEILLKVLPSMEGMGSRIRDASMPRAMPMIIIKTAVPLPLRVMVENMKARFPKKRIGNIS